MAQLQLRGAERYSREKLPALEKHVDEQVASKSFDLEANLALLRLYQFQPHLAKPAVLAKVLVKALMQLPSPDYKLCIHLVPERSQAEEPVASVVALADSLENTKLSDFWAACSGSLKGLLDAVPGFYEAVRAFILHIVGINFQKVSSQTLGEYLQIDAASLKALIAEKTKSAGWKAEGAIVVLPRNAYNQPVTQRSQDIIKFDQVAPVLNKLTVGM